MRPARDVVALIIGTILLVALTFLAMRLLIWFATTRQPTAF